MKKYLLLFFCVISSHVLAAGMWSNTEDGFGANFPVAPTRVGAATTQGAGYAYQSSQSFDNGGALFAITVVPVSSEIFKNKSKDFLEASNAAFVQSMGQKLSQAKVKWLKFGGNKKRLNYEFDFLYNGVSLKGVGFWIMDKNRAIRVSVAYTNTLTSQQARETISFLDSFFILSNRNK